MRPWDLSSISRLLPDMIDKFGAVHARHHNIDQQQIDGDLRLDREESPRLFSPLSAPMTVYL
jgi:hypothetical protein